VGSNQEAKRGDGVTYRDKSGAWIATYPEQALEIPVDRKFRASDVGLDHRILRVLHADKYIKMVGRTKDKNNRHMVAQWEVTDVFKKVMKRECV
jgi:hypothetical protein